MNERRKDRMNQLSTTSETGTTGATKPPRAVICLRYDHLLLHNILVRDEAELVDQAPNNINFNTKIKYRCKCGVENQKTISAMYKLGCVCKKCIEKVKQAKKEATTFEKYGVKATSSLEVCKQKRRETCIKKYGVDNAAKHPSVQRKISQYLYERHAKARRQS